MRIAVLESSYAASTSIFKEVDGMYACSQSFIDLYGESDQHQFIAQQIDKADAVQQVIRCVRENAVELVVNLCDGAFDEDRAGAEVIETLDALRVPYTGADLAFYKLDKVAMKLAAHAEGIACPAFVLARSEDDVRDAAAHLPFPVIFKHPNSGGSYGMTRLSKCGTGEELLERSRALLAEAGSLLIEEFVPGREFTVLVAEDPDDPRGAVVIGALEYIFPEGEDFKHFESKWGAVAERIDWRPLSPDADPALYSRLEDAAVRAFVAMGGTSYGRADFRVDPAGLPVFLEMNQNCGLYYPKGEVSTDFIVEQWPGGHRAFTDLLLRAALRQHARRRPKFDARIVRGAEGAPERVASLYATEAVPRGGLLWSPAGRGRAGVGGGGGGDASRLLSHLRQGPEPNVAFRARTGELYALEAIERGEELRLAAPAAPAGAGKRSEAEGIDVDQLLALLRGLGA
eukprot:tig00022075_g23634.t1